MAKIKSFEEWTGGASEQEIQDMIATVNSRFWIFLLISLIPFVNFITMGCAIFCYNNLSLLKSRGRSQGNNGVRFILMLYALIIPPIIVVKLCAYIKSIGAAVLGLECK